MTDDEAFLDVSRRLTGLTVLPTFLAREYRARIVAAHGDDVLARVLSASDDELTTEATLRAVAEDIVMLWYASATVDERGVFVFGTLGQYFSSQLWQVIRAHPPGLSGGYMGHWRYPPE